jgi:predicted dehydrogenase
MTRVGFIGCGSMAGSHMQVFEALNDRLEFAAFADVDIEKAREAAKSFPGAQVASDYREVFDFVDAFVIAVPHDLHYEIGMACIAAGKHVLMEKPLALTEPECLALIDADTSPNPVLMLGYVMRHNPLWKKMGDYIRNKEFGDAFHVSIWTEQYTHSDRAPWLGQAKRLGGGQLFSHGCHYIDLLLQWMGKPVSGTHVGTNFGTPWMEREGTSNVSLKFASGATAYHFGTWGAKGSRLKYSVHAHCAEGMLELDHAAGTIILHRDKSGGDLPALETVTAKGERVEEGKEVVIYRQEGDRGKAVGEQMTAFLDCIEQSRKPEVSAAASLPSLRVIWRLYEAEENGTVADLSDI